MLKKSQGADDQESTVQTRYQADGKDYTVTRSSDHDTLSVKRIDNYTTEAILKLGGKVVGTTRREGRSRSSVSVASIGTSQFPPSTSRPCPA